MPNVTNNNSDGCLLCAATKDAASRAPKAENTPLHETKNFVVIPCVGPLVSGHVLVVTRKHYLSFAQLDNDIVAEYEALRDELTSNLPDLLEAEHGPTGENCAGACVTHAHIHWIPGMSKYADAFEGAFPKLLESSQMEFFREEVPYMMVRAFGLTRIYNGSEMISQMLRMIICSNEGTLEYDWRKLPRDFLIAETLEFWSGNEH